MRKANNLPPSCAVVTKYGNLNFLEPSGPLRACNGTELPFLFTSPPILSRCMPLRPVTCLIAHPSPFRSPTFLIPRNLYCLWGETSPLSSNHRRYGLRAGKTQLSSVYANAGTLAVSNYMFRPPYWPSSGFDVLLTVHLSIILVINQLNAQFLL